MPSARDSSATRLGTLIEANRLLMGALDPDELIGVVLDSVLHLFDAEGTSLALVDEPQAELVFTTIAGKAGLEEFRMPLGKGIAGWVAEHGEPAIVNDVASDPRFYGDIDAKSGFRTRAILCVPLRFRDEVIGALEALNPSAPGGFTQDDLELLDAFAGIVATAIDRSRAWQRLNDAHAVLRESEEDRHGFVLGRSPAMEQVVDTAKAAAATRSTVLLLGESGVGKEIAARAIHRWSPRADGPFVAVNCVALSPQLLESELFGHEKGAFTGAIAQRRGKFELAHGGTIFLDEIGDLAPDLQAKLLRVLQEREIQRVGGVKDIRVDVRVIAATNRDLARAMSESRFREDLFYRLNVVTLTIPPLRERREDIPVLVDSFLRRYARETGRPGLRITDGAVASLRARDWRGNVRELQNAIERAVVLSESDVLAEADFEAAGASAPAPAPGGGAADDGIDEALPLAAAVDAFKAERIRQALAKSGGNHTRAAKLLGLRHSSLSRLMKSLGL